MIKKFKVFEAELSENPGLPKDFMKDLDKRGQEKLREIDRVDPRQYMQEFQI